MMKTLVLLFAIASTFATVTVENPADTPVLISAKQTQSKIMLIFSHPSATRFTARIRWQDDNMTDPATSVIANVNAKPGKLVTNIWAARVKIIGDTNWVSVAVAGKTNWSNEIVVIP